MRCCARSALYHGDMLCTSQHALPCCAHAQHVRQPSLLLVLMWCRDELNLADIIGSAARGIFAAVEDVRSW
jgi:hypothetical protein